MNRTHPHITAKIICDSVGTDLPYSVTGPDGITHVVTVLDTLIRKVATQRV